MASNEIYRDANHLALPVPSGTKSGDPVRVGSLNGVATTDRADTSVSPYSDTGEANPAYNQGGGNVDGEASVALAGGWEFPVGFAAAPGAPVYLDDAGTFYVSAGDDRALYGHALSTTPAGGGTLIVRISNTA